MNDKTLTFTHKGEYYRLAVISGELFFSRFDTTLSIWTVPEESGDELARAVLLALLR